MCEVRTTKVISRYNQHQILTTLGMAGFDQSRYLGAWYEYANVFEIYQIGGTCVRATYTDEGTNVGVFNEAINTMYKGQNT